MFLSLNEILNHYDTKKKAQNAVKSATHGVSTRMQGNVQKMNIFSAICSVAFRKK